MAFVPSAAMDLIHNWHRFNAADGLAPASNVFDPSDKAYYESVASIAFIYIALGIVFFLAVIVIESTCGFCCRPQCCPIRIKTPEQREDESCLGRCCGVLFSARIWYIGAVLVMLAGTSAALAQIGTFQSSISGFLGAVTSFQSLLVGAGASASGTLAPALSQMAANLTALQGKCGANPAYYGNVTVLLTLATAASNGASGFSTASSTSVNAFADKVNTQQDTGDKVHLWGIVALGSFLGAMLLSVGGLCANKCSARIFNVCNAVVVLTLLLVYIFAGVFAGAAVFGSDFCEDPSGSLGRIAAMANTDPSTVETLTYYTSCGNPGANASAAPTGALSSLANASSALTIFDGFLQNLNGIDTTWSADVALVNASFVAAEASLQSITASASCAPVYAIYSTIIDNMCAKAVNAIIVVWALATAACLLIFLVVASSARLCCAHPSAIAEEEAKQEANLPSSHFQATVGTAYNVSNNAAYGLPSASALSSGSAIDYK